MKKIIITLCAGLLAFTVQAKEITLSADNTLVLADPVFGNAVGKLLLFRPKK